MEETYKEYDNIVRTVFTNVLIERGRCGRIILYNFDPAAEDERLYFNVAAIVADMEKENLYLNMSFFKYLKFKRKFKKRKNLKWLSPFYKSVNSDDKTEVKAIMNFITEQLKLDPKIFREINNEYYRWSNQ